jgi:hypothetical protein
VALEEIDITSKPDVRSIWVSAIRGQYPNLQEYRDDMLLE